jgi:hypothetical protein
LFVILGITCVANITGFQARLHFLIISFCIFGIWIGSIFAHKSHLAIIIQSDTFIILSISFTADCVSIFAINFASKFS